MTPTNAPRTRVTRTDHGNRNGRLVRRGIVPAAVVAGFLGATTVPVAASTKPLVTSARIPGLGTVLESGHRPLYEWLNDPKGHSACTGGCATIFPPLIVSAKAAHHLGKFSGLGTIHRSKGVLQVAIHGHALYFNAGDRSATHAAGQGFNNIWFTVHTNGTLDRSASSAPTSTVPSTSQPSSTTSTSPKSPSSTTRPTSAPNVPAPTSPAPTTPPTSPPPPPTTSPPPPPTTTPPPPTTTTTAPSGGGVGF